MPARRDDVRLGTGVSSFTFSFFLGTDFFLWESLDLGVEGLVYRPEDWASRVSFFRRASRSAMFARRCFSKSEISEFVVVWARAMFQMSLSMNGTKQLLTRRSLPLTIGQVGRDQ